MECLGSHGRYYIRLGFVKIEMIKQSPFSFHAIMQFRTRRSLEQIDRWYHNSAVLDEIYLPLEDQRGICVEAYYKSPRHNETGCLKLSNIGRHIPSCVLPFPGGN